MWADLPLEFNVFGTPVSSQSGNARARREWQSLVLNAAVAQIDGSAWAFDAQRLAVTLLYFPAARMAGDIDNIVKLTLDALKPRIYLDDDLIDRVLVQRFQPGVDFAFGSPSDTLLDAISAEGPVLFMRIADVPLEDLVP